MADTEQIREPEQDGTIVTTLHATPIRRVFAYSVVFCLGALLILLAFFQPPAFGWQIFLIALGGATLLVAERMRRASAVGLVLTEHELRDTTGVVLARLDEVVGVDRGHAGVQAVKWICAST